MTLLQPAKITSAYLKMGIMGKQGAGKTKTAGKVAIGLIQYLKKLGISYASKPVAFFDTETGSDYLIPDFEAAGIPLVVAKTKTLVDLIKAMDEAETDCSALIIDSITHPYREMIAAYLKTKKRTFLQIDDWNYLKGDYGWQMFTNRFVNSKLHIIMCGRAGDDLEQYTDDQGKRQLEKIGTKMKGEAETGFEPSLLVLMELVERNSREATGRKRTFINRATIIKDRWDQINGDQIDDPDFVNFLPHISRLALGGEHVGVQDTGDSQSILKTEQRDWQPVQRQIVLDEIESLLVLKHPSTSGADKQAKLRLLRQCFDASWTEMEKLMPLERLRQGYDMLHVELEKTHSKYHVAAVNAAIPASIAEIDELPAHSAPPVAAEAKREEVMEHQPGNRPSIAHSEHPTPKREEVMPSEPAGIQSEAHVASPQPSPSLAAGASPQATEDPGDDIPPMLDRRPKTVKDRLLADIPRLGTPHDLLRWSLTMSGVSGTLPKEAQEELAAAVMTRQAQLLNGAAAH